MSDANRTRPETDAPDPSGDAPAYGARPVRSTLQAIVRIVLGVVSLALLVGGVWALLR